MGGCERVFTGVFSETDDAANGCGRVTSIGVRGKELGSKVEVYSESPVSAWFDCRRVLIGFQRRLVNEPVALFVEVDKAASGESKLKSSNSVCSWILLRPDVGGEVRV